MHIDLGNLQLIGDLEKKDCSNVMRRDEQSE